MLTVYSRAGCQACKATMRHLEKLCVEAEVVELKPDSVNAEAIRRLGYSQLPVVMVDENTHWCGYRPDRLDELSDHVSKAL